MLPPLALGSSLSLQTCPGAQGAALLAVGRSHTLRERSDQKQRCQRSHWLGGFVLAGEFSHKLQRLSSNGTMSSSEELEEKDENAASFEQSR